jgi:hypothetical protein
MHRFLAGTRCIAVLATALGGFCFGAFAADAQTPDRLPSHIPPRRASQLKQAPAGVNTSLPRLPYLPWTETWWTRMYDAGMKYVRIGQYEDTSDVTGWDWTEQKKGLLRVAPEVDEYIDSLIANGATIELQLLYGNPIYTASAGILPTMITPTPATVHNPDFNLYSIFWPPTTPDQTSAFLRYARFMVNHFRGRIQYYSLWNEEDGSYWNPRPDPQQYGRLLAAFIKTVRETEPNARTVYGGQASFSQEFARSAMDACDCAGQLDVFAYHTYPGGFVRPAPPESVSAPSTALREAVSSYPKIRPAIQFWEDEYNSVPSRGPEMTDAIQAKYVARMVAGNWAAGVPTFLWELVNDTSTDEGDDFGIVHGMMHKPSDFQPRPVFYAIQRINALLGDTRPDPGIQIKVLDSHSLDAASVAKLSSYGFRSDGGKSIVTYWLALESHPENPLQPVLMDVSIPDAGMEHPVLIDVDADRITPLQWESSGAGRSLRVPVTDSVMAIADADYFDWPVLPAAPSGLHLAATGASTLLTWKPVDEYSTSVVVERRFGSSGKWTEIARLAAGTTRHTDEPTAKHAFYRIHAVGESGKSGYSNVVSGDLP